MTVDILSDRIDRALNRITERAREKLTRICEGKALGDFSSLISDKFDIVNELFRNANIAYTSSIANKKMPFISNVAKLDALNPLAILARGYSVAQKGTKSISSVNDADVGDIITLRLNDGSIDAEVKSKMTF